MVRLWSVFKRSRVLMKEEPLGKLALTPALKAKVLPTISYPLPVNRME